MWCFAWTLLFFAGVDLSCSLVVQGTRFPLPARDQQTGATLQAISTADQVDLRYATNIIVNGQTFKVAIDTGSSDLWLHTTSDFTFDNTGVPVDDGFTASDVSGTIGFASVTMGGYTVNQQVFNNATSVTLAGILDAGLDGLIGLSFDGRGPSPLTDTLQQNGMSPALGEPFLFNVFGQTPDQNNFIGISLSRTDDLEGSADASFTINEVDSRYEAVLDAPVLPLFPGNNGVWSVLMDGMTVDGQTVPLPPSQAGAPPGKLVVTMDTGTPGAELLPPFVDAIYSRIPGAELVEISDGSQLWTLPCNTTTVVSLQFGGQSFPIHPLDLSEVPANTTGSICVTPWSSSAPNPEEDLLFGDSFMRNFYSVFNFGDSVSRSPSPSASMQLLSQTDATAAAADAIKVRTALAASLSQSKSASASAPSPQGTGSPDAPVHKNGGRSGVSLEHTYVPIVVGLLGGTILGIHGGF